MKNTVILKSYKDGIAIYLDDTLEFEQLCLDLAQKFRDSARFFGDMQVAVSFEAVSYTHLDVYKRQVYEYGEQTLVSLKDRFDEIDKTAEYNQLKVLKAMQDCRVSEACLLGTTGYGYNDIGRDTLEAVYASLFLSLIHI